MTTPNEFRQALKSPITLRWKLIEYKKTHPKITYDDINAICQMAGCRHNWSDYKIDKACDLLERDDVELPNKLRNYYMCMVDFFRFTTRR